jgi:hypothetical protein
MPLFDEFIRTIVETDDTIKELTQPPQDNNTSKLITRVGFYIQNQIMFNSIRCAYEHGHFVISNPKKSRLHSSEPY